MKKFLLFMCLAAGIVACGKNDGQEPTVDPDPHPIEMIVVSEGQYGQSTAALSAVTGDGTVVWDVFRDVNDKPLGDAAADLVRIDGKYFVTLSNSKQIKVIEPGSFRLLGTIDYETSGSPLFIVPVSETEAIVSDYAPQLTRINYKTYKVVEHIPIAGMDDPQVGGMTVAGGKLFGAGYASVAVWDMNNIRAASARKIELAGTMVETARMILDKNGKLWVMSYVGGADGRVILNCLDPASEIIERTVEIPFVKNTDPNYTEGAVVGASEYNRLETDRTKGKLYFILDALSSGGSVVQAVFTLDVDKNGIDSKPYRKLIGLGMMYGLGISPDGEVYLCDCLDYTAQRGYLRHYKADGSVDSKRVGIFPRKVHFTGYDK